MREPAEPASSARKVLVEAVTALSWLAPGAASLAVLGRLPTPSVWSQVRFDPGAVLLLLRQSNLLESWRGVPSAAEASVLNTALQHPSLIDAILYHLRQPSCGVVDWQQPPARLVYRTSLACAHLAEALAERTAVCSPEKAWICGLLVPLGSLALCSTQPDVLESLPLGLDQAILARRLARRWELPGWVAAVCGHLALSGTLAEAHGAELPLFHVARTAVGLAQEKGYALGLVGSALFRESTAALGLTAEVVEEDWIAGACVRAEAVLAASTWSNPYEQPLLLDLLTVAAEHRRLQSAHVHQRLEAEVDQLHQALEEQIEGEAERLQTGKLEALAEFAAGAGHEINNPLAVISGQAQYLLGHEGNWFTAEAQPHVRKALQAVIGQTRRVHGLLRDLMQFARPPAPVPAWFDLPTVLGEVAAGLKELAEQRRVRVEIYCPVDRLRIHSDADQVRVALTCLLRNGIEAAPAEGWARLSLAAAVAGQPLEVHVEDSGSGPEPTQRPHLFDPFFSGRSAGRGRGLGLPIAWRLMRQQGGDVRLEPPLPHQPTRFVLSLPWVELSEHPSPSTTSSLPGTRLAS